MTPAMVVGLAAIIGYVGLIVLILFRSAKTRPVEKLPDQAAGERTRESMAAWSQTQHQFPNAGTTIPAPDATLDEGGHYPRRDDL